MNIKNKIKISSIISLILFLSSTKILFASASAGLSIPTASVSQFSITSLGAFVGALVTLMFLIAGILVFAYLVWGGIEWITSGGDKSKTQSAREKITAALVGLAIVSIALAIIRLAEAFFGFSIQNFNFPRPY